MSFNLQLQFRYVITVGDQPNDVGPPGVAYEGPSAKFEAGALYLAAQQGGKAYRVYEDNTYTEV